VEVGIHGGVGSPVSKNDGVAGEPDGESGEDGGVGWLERVIPLCPYVPNSSFQASHYLDLRFEHFDKLRDELRMGPMRPADKFDDEE